METFLLILFVLMLMLLVFLAVAYFFALHDFKKQVVEEIPNLWVAARAAARPLESWAPIAYRLLQKCRNGSIDGHQLSVSLVAAHKKARALLYVTAVLFMLFIVVALSFDAVTS